MSFVQIIELKTTRIDELRALADEWRDATNGTRTVQRVLVGQDRDQPDTLIEVVEFPSYEEAMRNSELPATKEIAAKLATLLEGEAVYRNLDVIEDRRF